MNKTSKEIILLAAIANNGVVGDNNALPWRLKGDLKHFKELTMGKPIIMGRKTYESIGKPLPGRVNIVLSKSKEFEGCVMATDAIQALKQAYKSEHKEIYIIGGPQVWKEFSSFLTQAIITHIPLNIEGTDKFIMEGDWKVSSVKDMTDKIVIVKTGEEKEISYQIKTWVSGFGTEK